VAYHRSVKPSETVFLRLPGATMIEVFHIAGAVDAAAFQSAVVRLQRAYPILNSRITTDARGQSWYEELPEPFAGTIVERRGEDTYQGVVDREIADYFDIWSGPLARLTLVQGADRSEVVVACNHLASDGRGAARMVHHLLRFIADPDLVMEAVPEVYAETATLKHARPKVTALAKWIRFWAAEVMYATVALIWRVEGFTMDHDDPYMTSNMFGHVARVHWRELHFTRDETKALAARCREHGVTLNSALTMAALKLRRQLDPAGDNGRQETPTDIRRYLRGAHPEQANLLVSMLFTAYAYDDAASVWENARRYGDRLIAKGATRHDAHQLDHLTRFPSSFYEAVTMSGRIRLSQASYAAGPLAGRPWFRRLNAKSVNIAAVFGRGSEVLDPSLIMSNVGVTRFDAAYGDLRVERAWGLAPQYKQGLGLSAAITRGQLAVAVSIMNIRQKDQDWPETLPALVDGVVAGLKGELLG
jgi:hypothetical protein